MSLSMSKLIIYVCVEARISDLLSLPGRAPITIINTANNVAYRSKEQLVAENEGYDVILTTHPGV